MATSPQTIELMEQVYEVLADAIDKLPEAHSELFLTKLALLLAKDAGSATRFRELTQIAALDL